jgi:molecular chaperone GrpE (heat shock protein)
LDLLTSNINNRYEKGLFSFFKQINNRTYPMIIKLNKFAIAEIDDETIMLKQFYDNRNGNAVMVKFELKRFYDKFESALIFVRVTSSETKKTRDITSSRIRLRKGENFPLYYVSSIDAVMDLSLIFEIQTNNFSEYEKFGSIKVYPHAKNEKFKFIDAKVDTSRIDINKYRTTSPRTSPFGLKTPAVEEINIGPKRQRSFGMDDNMSPAKIEKLKRQMGLTDDLLMQRLGLTDDALRMRLGLTDELIQNFIDTAVNMVRENLGISDDILNILSFNTQQYSMDIQRLRSTIEKFKGEINYVRTTIDKMNIPGLEKDYKYVEKRYDWAKLRCEQLERKFVSETDELSETMSEKNEALDQLLQEFLDWTDEKRQKVQGELDRFFDFQTRYAEAIQMIDNLKIQTDQIKMIDPFERACRAAERLYYILNQDKNVTSQSIKQKFPKDLQDRLDLMLKFEDIIDRLLPPDMTEQNANNILEAIQTIKNKFFVLRNRFAFYPPVLSEAADGFIQKIQHISYQDIEEETRLHEEKNLKEGPWKSMDPLNFYQERVDLHLEQLRQQYYKEKDAALPEMFKDEKPLTDALNNFVVKDLFAFIQNKLPDIEDKYAKMASTDKPVAPLFNDTRKDLMTISNIQAIVVEPEVDVFDQELHQSNKKGHRPDLPDQVVLETLSTGYRLGAVGPVLEKTLVVINSTG